VEIEGKLQIDLYCQHARVLKVDIQSSRPLQAVRIFQGKAVAEVLQTLPLLYHVCGVAQASAAVTACEQAMAIPVSEATVAAREMLVWMETAREHMWRIIIDWSDRLGEEKNTTRIAQLQQYLPELRKALFADGNGFYVGAEVNVNIGTVQSVIQGLKQLLEDVVFAVPVEQWLECHDQHGLDTWLSNNNTLAKRMLRQFSTSDRNAHTRHETSCLPMLDEASLHLLLTQVDADEFVARPNWQGQACETSAFCRQQYQPLLVTLLTTNPNPLMTRMLARLTELARIPNNLERLLTQVLTSPPIHNSDRKKRDTGIGLGQVEAARGRLVHRLELTNGLIKRYQILAPTEWNFHPQGVAAQLIMTLPVDDEVIFKQHADLLINTIDPCVRYEMTVH